MDVSIVTANFNLYLEGLWTTVVLVSGALLIGLALAIPLAIAANSTQVLVSGAVFCYSYCFRGTPLLVQMYMLYYGAGQFEAMHNSFVWPVLREAYWCD